MQVLSSKIFYSLALKKFLFEVKFKNFSCLTKFKKFFFKEDFSRFEQKIFLQMGLQGDMDSWQTMEGLWEPIRNGTIFCIHSCRL